MNVPEGARIECASDLECPSGYVCRSSIGRCFEASTLDDTAPGIVDGSLVIAPSIGKRGDTFQITFVTTESLSEDPNITVELPAGTDAPELQEASTDRVQNLYDYVYTPPDSAIDGSWPVDVRLSDRFGNPAEITLGQIVLDLTPPSLLGPASMTPRDVGPSSSATLSFTLNEATASTPQVVMTRGTETRTWTFDAQTDTTWQFIYAPPLEWGQMRVTGRSRSTCRMLLGTLLSLMPGYSPWTSHLRYSFPAS